MYVFTPPPSKSLTNRALILAALAEGKSVIENFADCDDTKLMVKALRKLGIKIIKKNNVVEVIGLAGSFSRTGLTISCGNAGTTFRFLTALLALNNGTITLDGSKRMRQRPIGNLVKSLKQAGIRITSNKNFPPLKIYKSKVIGGRISINSSESSQFLSALLMILPFMRKNTEIHVEGELVSKPYVDMTLEMQKQFGVNVRNIEYKKFVLAEKNFYGATKITIEPDASSASYFFATAAVAKKKITIHGLTKESNQADIKFIGVLKRMGCKIEIRNSEIVLTGKRLKGISIDLNSSPDIVQTLAVTACFAKGKTKIRNVANLRLKETDRLKALSTELRKIGAYVNETEDGLEITPGKLRAAEISTYNDHRMAMSFAIAKLVNPKIKILNKNCVKKSFPNFWNEFSNMKRIYKL
ncbi:MAG: 3-phosphoshikimate 1-carboxyvinyltransferase [Ignavibacteria bacterium]|nr:3-phosphoshikimate 1-carboxyvinyltransferase [Ignavibacteria bacterium]